MATSAQSIGNLIYSTTAISLLEADILMGHVLQQPREYLYAHPEQELTPIQAKAYEELCNRRANGEPTAYLVGHKEFYGLEFNVTPDVLIPRPDTEVLIDTVIEYCNCDSKNMPWRVPADRTITLVDVGTGAGPIAVTLKHELPQLTVHATDISPAAVSVAQHNAKQNNSPITFHTGDVLAGLPTEVQSSIDVITFNAPYLTKTEAKKKMLAFEPQVALTPTGKPTELIERMFSQLAEYAPNWQAIFLEIGHRQANQVAELAIQYIPQLTNNNITVIQDLGGFDRVVSIYR